MELQEFFEHMEQRRASAVDAAAQRYRSLSPLLSKVSLRQCCAVHREARSARRPAA
jgi:hypothetical protein